MTDLTRLRSLLLQPGFLPTRERWEEVISEIGELVKETEITRQVLEGTGHTIEKDETGRYFLHGHNCAHYPLPEVKGE